MTAFLGICGVLVLAVLFHLLRPLWRGQGRERTTHDAANVAIYRDQLRELEADRASGSIAQADYDKAKLEIEARLLDDIGGPPQAAAAPRRAPLAAIALAAILPVCALALYIVIGTPQAIEIGPSARNAGAAGGHEVTDEQISAMVERLATRLQSEPDNVQGWAMLARSYSALGRFKEANTAFERAIKLAPDDAQLFADYADALGMAQGRNLQGEPEKLIARALKLDPANVKALALAGTAAFERKDYTGAIRQWERVLQVGPQDPEFMQSVRASIDEAKAAGGKGSAPAAAKAAAPAADRGIRGVASIAPALKAKVAPTDTVFIYAHAAEGSRMPLAILKKQGSDLPVSFALDDSMAMNPAAKLSSAVNVVVTARVSKGATATPQPGDLQGESKPVRVGAERVEVVIDSVVR